MDAPLTAAQLANIVSRNIESEVAARRRTLDQGEVDRAALLRYVFYLEEQATSRRADLIDLRRRLASFTTAANGQN